MRAPVAALLLTLLASAASAAPITLALDAREAPRKLLHAHLEFPVTAGPLSLSYPKWIPGEHGPTGPITNLAGPRLRAGGVAVPWRRDSVDMFTFHCVVPAGARVLEADLDLLGPVSDVGYSAAAATTAKLAMLSWNQVLLYPTDADIRAVTFAASVTLPDGWRYATALPVARRAGARVEFAPVSLEKLVDSPVMAGAHFRTIPLDPGAARPTTLDIACDTPEGLAIPPAAEASMHRLAAEAGALFGARHYDHYDFLVCLSDHIAHFGLEHHECSDDQAPERFLTDPDARLYDALLLPHEFVHSWNGKYRRPADLTTTNFNTQPMRCDLLWVYEGLTQYLGFVLAARCGLVTNTQFEEELAARAARLETHHGRDWRPVLDTAVAAQLLYAAPEEWGAARRGTDFYDEGLLIWLEADARIRKATAGARSLDDFCRRFHGGASGAPAVVPYTLDDVLAALNAIAPGDWRSFFAERIDAAPERVPVGGIAACGWKVVYADSMTDIWNASEKANKVTDLSTSIGFVLRDDGSLSDVVPGSPADQAGVTPGMKLVAVNERRWSGVDSHSSTPDVLLEAVHESRTGRPIDLLMDNGEFLHTYRLDYRGGDRYPRLERVPGTPDLIAEILKPRTPAH